MIRSEKPGDYNAIACVNYEAFYNWRGEPFTSEMLITDLLRHSSYFDPELSLVAELDGNITGHVLLCPFKFLFSGEEIPGVILGPVAVSSEYQAKGIGGMLISKGHELAHVKGYAFSLLCGHMEYYPRFGYKQRMFSERGCIVDIESIKPVDKPICERTVRQRDISILTDMWYRFNSASTLSICPGTTIADWVCHCRGKRASVFETDGRVIGYMRYDTSRLGVINFIMADSAENLGSILAHYAKIALAGGINQIEMPLYNDDPMLLEAGITLAESVVKASNAFMIRSLDDRKGIVGNYCDSVAAGGTKPGIITFPVMYDVE